MQQLIIENQSNPLIFERFCAALISKSENITLVTTSFNYDRGIDARSIQPTRGRLPFVLCVTLARDLDEKVSADIISLLKRSNPETIYYCSSSRLTEDACIKLEAQIRALVNRPISVRVLGSIQLADIAKAFPKIFESHFHSEIDNISQVFEARKHRETDTEARSLRMALMVYGSEDSQELREKMSCQMVIDALSSGTATEGEIAVTISKDFSLPKGLSSTYVLQILNTAALRGLVVKVSGKWELTEAGKIEATRIPNEAAANLLEGRAVIRECIETLIGQKLADPQFEQTWMTLLEGFQNCFIPMGSEL